jgi:F0F1-type ATP synthase membrane subunit a
MGAAAILSNLIILVVVALEFVVAALQTYVFTVLSVIYINEAILLH